MSYVKRVPAIKIPFPSDKKYFVMWSDRVSYGALREARQRAVVVKMDPETNEPKPEFDAIAYNDYSLLAHIQSWNIDDESGQILPLTLESLSLLDGDDVGVLNERLAGAQQTQEKTRKND